MCSCHKYTKENPCPHQADRDTMKKAISYEVGDLHRGCVQAVNIVASSRTRDSAIIRRVGTEERRYTSRSIQRTATSHGYVSGYGASAGAEAHCIALPASSNEGVRSYRSSSPETTRTTGRDAMAAAASKRTDGIPPMITRSGRAFILYSIQALLENYASIRILYP